MELKHVRIQHKEYLTILLIEPVWNWNKARQRRLVNNSWLLIEPVWNWNICRAYQRGTQRLLLIEPVWNWNEVKGKCVQVMLLGLLIELVWNWNCIRTYHADCQPSLLIEPVWNWNLRHSPRMWLSGILLIEPVWNWNITDHADNTKIVSFNRTSMELKLPSASR